MIFNFDIDSAYHEFVKRSKQISYANSPVIPAQHSLVEAGVKYMSAPAIFLDGADEPILAHSWAYMCPEHVDWTKFELVYQVRHDVLANRSQLYIVRGVMR